MRDRKAEHIDLALEDGMQLHASYFDDFFFDHLAVPEIDYADIDPAVEFLGRQLRAPLLISCMTGGTEQASRINRHLAVAAEATGIALGLGSQRKALENPAQAATFKVRDLAPTIPLLANLGAVQLNYGFGIDECRQAVEMIDADALVLHLNPLQEALQPEGQCNFSNLVPRMAEIAAQLEVPVIVKEIGCGLSAEAGRVLRGAGLKILDSAGLGGTSWARIEAKRANDVDLGELFADWGVPTPRSIRALRSLGDVTIIASGGVRNGIDVAKAIALGGDIVGLAQPFLAAANESAERAIEKANRLIKELTIAMFCTGARSIKELQHVTLHRRQRAE